MDSHTISVSGHPGDNSFSWEEDLQLLLESPTARAASANFFSSRLGTLDSHAANNTGGSLGSPDFTRHLNLAGTFNDYPQSGLLHHHDEAASEVTHFGGSLQSPRWAFLAVHDQGMPVTAPLRDSEQQQQRQQQQRQQQVRQLHRGHNRPRIAPSPAVPVPAYPWTTDDELPAAAKIAVAPPLPAPSTSVYSQRALEHQALLPELFLSDNNHLIQTPEGVPALHLHTAYDEPSWPEAVAGAHKHLMFDGNSLEKQVQQQQQQVLSLQAPGTKLPPTVHHQQHHAAVMKMDDGAAQDAPHRAPPEQLPRTATRGGPVADSRAEAFEASISTSVSVQAGALVWAKYPRFPWWPAVVISPTADVSPPPPTSVDSTALVLVRFLGTYDASWLDRNRAVSAWTTNLQERSGKTKAAAFLAALREAKVYNSTGVLPEAFVCPPALSQAASAATAAVKSRSKQGKYAVHHHPYPNLSAATITATTNCSGGPDTLVSQSPHQELYAGRSPLQPVSPGAFQAVTVVEPGASEAGAQAVPVAGAGDEQPLMWHQVVSGSSVAQEYHESSKSQQSRGGRRSSRAAVAGPAAGLRSVRMKRAATRHLKSSRRSRPD